MFEQTFKNIDDILYKDPGCDSELDYIGQTSWVLFFRYLDELEFEKGEKAELEGEDYEFIIEEKYRWSSWAFPKKENGELDTSRAIDTPELAKFVNFELFPYLAKFKKEHSDNPKTIEYKIGEIFSEIKNKIQSGYNMRAILNLADKIPFLEAEDKHELSHLYETKIKNMGNAGRNGGQYYTPRPLIRAMINVIEPKIGETIYDGAAGSCGFLCEAYQHLYQRMEKNTTNLETLQKNTFFGKEKKNLAYIIGIMNMILHGIEAPNLTHINTLGQPLNTIQAKDRHDIILANPPFGGKERKEIQQNFPIKTGETASLFLQHFIKMLKAGGRAAIVIKNTFLSNTDNASIALRQELLENCKLFAILDMPAGTFTGAGVKTVVLFFQKGEPTKKIWYYQLNPGRSLGKTNSLNDKDMAAFVKMAKTLNTTDKGENTAQSWTFNITDINETTYDLSPKNPNAPKEAPLRSKEEIWIEMKTLDKETNDILESLKELI